MTTSMRLRRSTDTDAGRYAAERFDQLYRPWRRRMRMLLPVALLPLAAVLTALVVWRPEQLEFALGALAGCTLTTYVWAVEPPEWIERWRTGAQGEQKTAQALAGLGPDWLVVHDIAGEYGNIDHVVVGPAGVFVLETKNLRGGVRVDGDAIVQTFRFGGDGARVLACRFARGGAARVSSALRADGMRLWVHAVVVVWGELPARHAGHNVTVVPGRELAAWLREQPTALSPALRTRAADSVGGMVRRSDRDDGIGRAAA